MLNAAIVDIAVGMVLTFFVMAMIASGAAEVISQLVMLREVRLQAAIRELLGVDELIKQFYESPFINALYQNGRVLRPWHILIGAPACCAVGVLLVWGFWVNEINASLFVIAAAFGLAAAIAAHYLYRVYQSCPDQEKLMLELPPDCFALAVIEVLKSETITFDSAGKTLGGWLREKLADAGKKAASGDADEGRKQLKEISDQAKQIFEETMKSLSGHYKKEVQSLILAASIVLCAALNIDAFHMVERLSVESGMRKALAGKAQKLVKDNPNYKPEKVYAELKGFDMPIGWTAAEWRDMVSKCGKRGDKEAGKKQPDKETDCGDAAGDKADGKNTAYHCVLIWFKKLFGILISAFAVSLGAPFWFDILQNLLPLSRKQSRQDKEEK